MILDLLLPAVPGLRLDHFTSDTESIHLYMTSTVEHSRCPCCQHPAQRVQSRYRRRVADLPWAGLPIRVFLSVRRFFCDQTTCTRRIFCERLGPVIVAYARRTARLTEHLQQAAFHLGGQAGARLLRFFGLLTSPDTLLRLIRQTEDAEETSLRIVGVDDWAFRKGQQYGTLLVDLERHRPVELLPDRTADTLADWLKAHPGVEVISRDRAAAYAEGATQGAPQACQVADRFHLMQNIGQALQRLVDRHPQVLQETAQRLADAEENRIDSESTSAPPSAESAPVPDQPEEQPPTEETPPIPSRWQHLFTQVKQLHHQGLSQRAIARQLQISRPTVKRYVAHDVMPPRSHTPSKTAPYWGYLQRRWKEGCYQCKQLFTELRQQGFTGSYASVFRALQHFPRPDRTANPPPPTPPRVSARRAATVLMGRSENLKPQQKQLQQMLCEDSATLARAYRLVQTFGQMVRKRKAELLDLWLAYAEQSDLAELRSFARHLRRDYDAVRAGLSLPWSNGQVEGQIHRLKLIKRLMYGRANFDLLRKRVLHGSE